MALSSFRSCRSALMVSHRLAHSTSHCGSPDSSMSVAFACRRRRSDLLRARGALLKTRATQDARRGPRDRPQHPVHALLDAVLGTDCVVDRKAADAAV